MDESRLVGKKKPIIKSPKWSDENSIECTTIDDSACSYAYEVADWVHISLYITTQLYVDISWRAVRQPRLSPFHWG